MQMIGNFWAKQNLYFLPPPLSVQKRSRANAHWARAQGPV